MAPIYDTDIAEERWSKAEWEHYELWESVELKLRRRKWLWIGAASFLFLVLSAVPAVIVHGPKWTSMAAGRRLSGEIGRIKREAAVEQSAFRIRFEKDGSLRYVVERGTHCSQASWETVRAGALVDERKLGSYRLVSGALASQLGIPGLVEMFCYDSLAGSDLVLVSKGLGGFGIVKGPPGGVNDLASADPASLSMVLLGGPSAEISFE